MPEPEPDDAATHASVSLHVRMSQPNQFLHSKRSYTVHVWRL